MTSQNGDRMVLQDKTNNVHLDSMSGNDMFRFRNLQQWYATSTWNVKRKVLRNILDICKDPLLLFILHTIFDRTYSRDLTTYNIGDSSFDNNPAEDSTSLELTALKLTMNDDLNWFRGLSKHDQLAVFIRLVSLGGINIITDICNHINHLIRSYGNLPNLQDMIGKNTEIQNSIFIVQDDLLLTDRLSGSEKILSKSNFDKNKSKITDVVYRDYIECTNEWKNKLDLFDQKYQTNCRTTELDSDLVQMLPVRHDIPSSEELLSNRCKEINEITTSTNGNTERKPLRLSHTLASVTEYKKARNYIDKKIDRRLKIQETMELDNKTEINKCKNVKLQAKEFNSLYTESADIMYD
ncbi:uncharacterized protein LOC132918946 [Rhopalosiphum padi]|uniref:uncharacterized protein LOC132918946 n=1 Tax=Rhopalosiphum padi TaxID=40932 RepID=UPI00298E1871|nr:uncharacterized protein LOC132918946 [Rhopalosiphum padi]